MMKYDQILNWKNKTLFQFMHNNESDALSLYFDIDEATDIDAFCQKVCDIYHLRTIYMV